MADAFGTLQIADNGGGAFFGGTAGSEFYLEDSEVHEHSIGRVIFSLLAFSRTKRKNLLLVTTSIFLQISWCSPKVFPGTIFPRRKMASKSILCCTYLHLKKRQSYARFILIMPLGCKLVLVVLEPPTVFYG